MGYYHPVSARSSTSTTAYYLKLTFTFLLLLVLGLSLYFHFSIYASLHQESSSNKKSLWGQQKKNNVHHVSAVDEAPPLLIPETERRKHPHHLGVHNDENGKVDESAGTATSSHASPPLVSQQRNLQTEDRDDSPVQEMDPSRRINSIHDLLHCGTEFFVLIERQSRKFLARPLDTNAKKSKWRERIFRIKKNGKYSSKQLPAFSIQAHTRSYMTAETNDRLTVDRLWARSFEQWHLEFDTEEHRQQQQPQQRPGSFSVMRLKAHRNDKYVSVFKADGKSLETVQSDKSRAAEWEVYPVTKCGHTSGNDGKKGDDGADDADVACWGPDISGYAAHKKKSRPGDGNKLPPPAPLRGPLLDSQDVVENFPHLVTARFPLFGSPKPLPSSTPKDSKDAFDTVLIAERTIRNWASMDGMVPVMFSDDPATAQIVDKVNAEIEEHKTRLMKTCVSEQNGEGEADKAESAAASTTKTTTTELLYHKIIPRHLRKHKTVLETNFEIHHKFKQPTYRGLFLKALEMFPDAPAVMYSNGDILFSPTLAQTIRKVASYFETQRKENPALRGWMIVGQRVNYVVPAKFILRDTDDDRYLASCDDFRDPARFRKKFPSSSASSSSSGNVNISSSFSTIMPQWVSDVEEFARTGELFQGNAEDYFIVSRNMFDWSKIPEFIVGGVAFDNWITGKGASLALKGKAIVVDAVKTITALHQNDAVNVKKSHLSEKSRFNLELASSHGGIHNGYTADAPHASERLADGTVTIYDKHALLFN